MWVSPPSAPAIWGWGTLMRQGGAACCSRPLLWRPRHPHLSRATASTARWGRWVTCPGSHRSSVAEVGSINCGSLNPPPFPTSAEADSVPGPEEKALGGTGPLFLFWF